MFGRSKKKSDRSRMADNFRLENEIYRKINELEHMFVKQDEIKEKGKNEKNQNLRQLIANESILIENKIKMQTLTLKEMQKTYLQNQGFLDSQKLLEMYEMIDQLTISTVADLKKVTFKIKDIQDKRQDEDKERDSVTSIFNESLNVYGTSLENNEAKAVMEQWARENEDELLNQSEDKEEIQNENLEEEKEDLSNV